MGSWQGWVLEGVFYDPKQGLREETKSVNADLFSGAARRCLGWQGWSGCFLVHFLSLFPALLPGILLGLGGAGCAAS